MKPFPLFRLTRPAATTALISVSSVGMALALAFGIPELAQAQTAVAAPATMVVYPAKGQTPKQQDRDKYECHDWARGQTGFDPTQPSQPAPAAGMQSPSTGASTGTTDGTLAKGAVRGAALGELASNDAGRGAAVGVLGAAAMERVKAQQAAQARHQQQAAQQQQLQQQQQAQRNQQRATYERAVGVCMEARGYAVK
jgi:hypothetical protein